MTRRTRLYPGQQITLGSARIDAGVCHFEITLQTDDLDPKEATQKLGDITPPDLRD